MKKLGEELGNTYRQYRDEKCARRLLISDMNDQKNLADHAAETKENGKKNLKKNLEDFFL